MSRIGKMPVRLGAAKATLTGAKLNVEGAKGKLSLAFRSEMKVAIGAEEIVVTRPNDQPAMRALHGLTRALINNMVVGVTEGFSKALEIRGVGFRASVQGKKIVFSLGFSHPVELVIPEGLALKVEKEVVTVTGCDKGVVGQFAAKIRGLRPPEPYKGTGIRYVDEYVKTKVGKRAAATTS